MSRYLSSAEHTSITHAWICLNINLRIHPPSLSTLAVSLCLPLCTASLIFSLFSPLQIHLPFPPHIYSPPPSPPPQDQWLARSPMLQRRVYHVMAAVRRELYVLGGNDLDYNNDRILVRHIDSYNMDLDQWTRCSFSLLTGGQSDEATVETCIHAQK